MFAVDKIASEMEHSLKRGDVLARLSEKLPEIQDRFGVKTLSVFGSVAREEANAESDVDLLVEFDKVPGLVGYMDLKFFLEALLKRSVDLATPRSLKPRIRAQILQEAVVVPQKQIPSRSSTLS